ncbi:MAG TPA: FG-GAP-like repeat-containing protein [Cyclobacteriaceae bacterium]
MKKHILYYNRLVKRYNKYQRKLQKASSSSYHYNRLDVLVKRVKNLYKRIQELGLALKAVTATGAIAMSLMLTPIDVKGQELTLESPNPVGFAHAENFSVPTFVDIDDDDDMDLVIGDRYATADFDNGLFVFTNEDGQFQYNTESILAGLPVQIDSVHNRPDSDNGGAYVSPAFVDNDGDGDLDLFIGNSDGNPDEETSVGYDRIRYFEREGDNFTEKFGAENPLSGFVDGQLTKLRFEDLDGDGDMDAIIGKDNGELQFWASNGDGSYAQQSNEANPFNGISVGERAAPAFADLDGDGDLDGYIGNKEGFIVFLQNNGSATEPSFSVVEGEANPFNGLDFNSDAAPTFEDIDGDGDLDAFVGSLNGPIDYVENDGGMFTVRNTNNLGLLDVGDGTHSAIADVDEDGDMDVLLSNNTTVRFFDNDEGAFTELSGGDNPFEEVVAKFDMDATISGPRPEFVDWNGDGFIDLFLGTEEDPDQAIEAKMQYFENDGSGGFVDMTDTDSDPFADYDPVGRDNPAFVDLDNDGDLDVFIGNKDGKIQYFENDGSGNLTEVTGAGNPFNEISFGENAAPEFYDWDRDGDQDAFIGKLDGELRYFENNGSGGFEEQFGDDNPLDGLKFVASAVPDFGDLNGDGVQDLLITDRAGKTWFFSNDGTASPPTIDTEIGDQFAVEGEAFTFEVPESTFSDPDNDIVVLRAEQTDGSPLPAWLTFNRSTGTFSGTPSAANAGILDLKVTAVDVDGNRVDAELRLFVQLITSLSDDVAQSLSIYPNPVTDQLHLITDWRSIKSIELYTLAGNRIKYLRTFDQEINLDVSDVAQGSYILRVLSEEGTITRHIVKQ